MMTDTTETLEVTVTVRRKNQMTVPDAIMQRLGLKEGDRLRLRVNAEESTFTVEPLPRTYAGIAPGLYGNEEEAAAYVDQERSSWDDE